MNFNELRAWIAVDGVELPQYNTAEFEDAKGLKTVTCWIPSEADKTFSINWEYTAPYRPFATAGWVQLDGAPVGGKIIHDSTTGGSLATAQLSDKTVSNVSARPFMFSMLETTDDDSYLDSTMAAKSIGEISIEIWRVTLGRLVPNKISGAAAPTHQKVHERSKKAMPHCVKFGKEIPVLAAQNTRETQKVKHIVTFVFKYRTLAILQANGIAPIEPRVGEKRRAVASPEPEPSQEKNDTAGVKRVKAEKKPVKKVKTEEKNPYHIIPGEVIDLT